MKKTLLLFALIACMLLGLSVQAKIVDRYKFTHRSQPIATNFIPKNATAIQQTDMIQEGAGEFSVPQKVIASVTLMAWDFETVADDNDWYVYDLDGFSTKSWEQPVGWTLHDETPSNMVLASQSWFTNAGATDAANDWAFSESFEIPNDDGAYEAMWDARAYEAAYADGYQVRIMEEATFQTLNSGYTATTAKSVISSDFISNSILLLTVAAENGAWTTRRCSLDAYKGKTVRLIWRNNSVDKNMLFLDNVIAYKKDDYASATKITAIPIVPYTFVPAFLAKDYSGTVTAKVDNNGSKALTGVTATFSGFKNDNPDFSDVVTVGDLPVGGTSNAVSKTYTFQATSPANSYYYTVEVAAAEEAVSYAESVTITGPALSDSVFARDNGVMSVYTAINGSSTSTTKKIGNYFEFGSPANLNSVTFGIYNCTAPTTTVRVFSVNNDFTTFTQVAASSPVTLTTDLAEEKLYTVKFTDLVLPAGKYVVTLDEPASKKMGLIVTSNSAGTAALYTINGTTWNDISSTLYIRLKVSQSTTGFDNQYAKDLKVYYSNNSIIVNGLKNEMKASVYSLAGQEVLSANLINEDNTINVNLSKGIYLLKIGDATYKVVVD